MFAFSGIFFVERSCVGLRFALEPYIYLPWLDVCRRDHIPCLSLLTYAQMTL